MLQVKVRIWTQDLSSKLLLRQMLLKTKENWTCPSRSKISGGVLVFLIPPAFSEQRMSANLQLKASSNRIYDEFSFSNKCVIIITKNILLFSKPRATELWIIKNVMHFPNSVIIRYDNVVVNLLLEKRANMEISFQLKIVAKRKAARIRSQLSFNELIRCWVKYDSVTQRFRDLKNQWL